MIEAIIFVVFPFAMIYAALSDVLTMTIPNRVSLLLIVGFLLIAPFIGLTWAEFGYHLLGFAVILAITFGLFAVNVLGGGDAKMMASTSLWIGFGPMLMDYFFYFSLAGAVLAITLFVLRKSPVSVLVGEVPALRRMVDEKDLPYGVALAVGALAVYADTAPMKWAMAQFI